MPPFDRVANLFRSTENHNLSAVKASLFSHPSHSIDRVHSSTTPGENDDGDSEHHDPDDEDDASTQTSGRPSWTRLSSLTRMHRHPDESHPHKKRWRRPLSFVWPGREHGEPGPAVLNCVVESAPIALHGTPGDSSGALVEGQLVLDVLDDNIEVDNLQLALVMKVVQKRPFQSHCEGCGAHEEELRQWEWLQRPVLRSRGTHSFPFSELLKGTNPASTESPAASISYFLKAEAIVARQPFTAGSSVTPLRLKVPLPVRRYLAVPDSPHHSIRVFPPTDIQASAHYTQVLRVGKKNTITVSLDGLSSKLEGKDVIECWRLKKASWKLEESVRTVARACERHADTEEDGDHESNRAVRTETRIIGEDSIPPTWKAEYSATTGHADLEFDFGLQAQRQLALHSAPASRYACDVTSNADSPTGSEVQVTHSLMLELVVSRARAATNQPDVATETGTGRILRMRFKVFLSEEGGGVAWDNQAPPLYEDVPPRPPGYDNGEPPRPPGYDDGEGDVISEGASEEGAPGGGEIYAARSSADGA